MILTRWQLAVVMAGPLLCTLVVALPFERWFVLVFAGLWAAAVYLAVTIGRTRAVDLTLADGFSAGDSVEVDCRLCGQFNRVPAARLRDRPICGRCKTVLMPGRRIVICRTSRIEEPLSTELEALKSDEILFWRRLSDHLKRKQKADDEQRRMAVN